MSSNLFSKWMIKMVIALFIGSLIHISDGTARGVGQVAKKSSAQSKEKLLSATNVYEKLGEIIALAMADADPPPKGCPQDTTSQNDAEPPPKGTPQDTLSMSDAEPPPKGTPQDTLSMTRIIKKPAAVTMQSYVKSMKNIPVDPQITTIKKYVVSDYNIDISLVKSDAENSTAYIVKLTCKTCPGK